MPLFTKTHKIKAQDVVKHVNEGLTVLQDKSAKEKAVEKASEEVSRSISDIKSVVYDSENGHYEAKQSDVEELVLLLIAEQGPYPNTLRRLVLELEVIAFEARKDVVCIFGNMMRRTYQGRFICADYVLKHDLDVVKQLTAFHENIDTALAINSGAMLRELIRHEQLAVRMLNSDTLMTFFRFVTLQNFEVASDAFTTLKDLLTVHKQVVSQWLGANYDRFVTEYSALLKCGNYFTRRQSLKLLGELLLDRVNFNTMATYIASPENLILIMKLLKDPSGLIQFEAFHVFKVFVANPNKTAAIKQILQMNRDKLIHFLENFHDEKVEEGDKQFQEERALLIDEISRLPPHTGSPTGMTPFSPLSPGPPSTSYAAH